MDARLTLLGLRLLLLMACSGAARGGQVEDDSSELRPSEQSSNLRVRRDYGDEGQPGAVDVSVRNAEAIARLAETQDDTKEYILSRLKGMEDKLGWCLADGSENRHESLLNTMALLQGGLTRLAEQQNSMKASMDVLLNHITGPDNWTRTLTGCSCYFDRSDNDCACCKPGGCQCSATNRHQCVECKHGQNCGKAMQSPLMQVQDIFNRMAAQQDKMKASLDVLLGVSIGPDVWTRTLTGCRCYFDHSSHNCACCEAGGCQCTATNRHQCVQCKKGQNCGKATDVAHGKQTRQSSTQLGRPGLSDAKWRSGSRVCTQKSNSPWWMVYLNDMYVVNEVRITSRLDCCDLWTHTGTGSRCYFDHSSHNCASCETGGCQCTATNPHQCVQCRQGQNCGKTERLADFEIRVGIHEVADQFSYNHLCHDQQGASTSGTQLKFVCRRPLVGSVATIQRKGSGSLAMCDVQVMSTGRFLGA